MNEVVPLAAFTTPLITTEVGIDNAGNVWYYTGGISGNMVNVGNINNPPAGTAQLFSTLSANGTMTVPAGYGILDMAALETGGVSMAGINIGTTPGGTDVIGYANMPIYKSTLNLASRSNIAKIWFSSTSTQILYITGSPSWAAGCIINVNIVLIRMIP